MPASVVIGLQWGDEGKGKISDFLSADMDIIIRFQGGSNAGHTIVIGEKRFVLHLIPSGILHERTRCVIANGVAVDPLTLVEEIEELTEHGITIDNRLQLSDRAHLVFRYHKTLDVFAEQCLGTVRLGTTGCGIGPAYTDKARRRGIRAVEMQDKLRLEERFRQEVAAYNQLFACHDISLLNADEEWSRIAPTVDILRPLLTDTVQMMHQALKDKKTLLFEGAQGTGLDIDFGTYPFVTSSNTSVGAVCTGSGVPPNAIDRVIGVLKSYTSRVGEGPFPTELNANEGDRLRTLGNEFGATTGRPRRCGWFDAVACHYAAMLNGADALAMMKLDVLDSLENIKICVAYDLDGERIDRFPADTEALERVVPIYEIMPGWQCSTGHIKSWRQLPKAAQDYIYRLAELVGVPVLLLSTGPKRDQTFYC